MLNDLRRRLADQRLTLETTLAARRLIASEGFDPLYGARPLRRFIAREVEARIGRGLLTGDVQDGAQIHLEAILDKIVITWSNPEANTAAIA